MHTFIILIIVSTYSFLYFNCAWPTHISVPNLQLKHWTDISHELVTMSLKFHGAYFPIVTSVLANLINSCNILQRLTRSSHNLAASSFLVSPLLKFIATRSRWTFVIVAGLKWAAMFARTNAFSGLFARLLQNASIKSGLNSRAKRRGTFSGQIVRHKFVCLCLGTFAACGTRCRKLDDKLGVFKYFPLVLADRTKTNESLLRRLRRASAPRPAIP